MAEMYSSRGVGAAGLTTGIIGTSLGALNSGLLGNLFGGCNTNCSENMAVNRYELNLQNDITSRDMEIAYLKGRDAAKSDSLELYKYVDGRFRTVEAQLAQQAVYNASNTAAQNCMSGQIAQLFSLCQLKIPNTSVCPGWGDVTVSVTPTSTT